MLDQVLQYSRARLTLRKFELFPISLAVHIRQEIAPLLRVIERVCDKLFVGLFEERLLIFVEHAKERFLQWRVGIVE